MGIKEKASKGIEEIKKEGDVLKGERTKDKQYSTVRNFDEEDSARFEFSRSKERLFNVNAWSDIPGIANATFELFDDNGNRIDRNKVEKGDFIKIDLPGPLPFYWVRVNEVTDEKDAAQFTVQPTYDPTDRADDKQVTDHFFQDKARSIFRVERKGKEITAMEIGINEAINNKEDEAGSKGVINTLVSEGGWAGFQKYQWKNLTDYLVGLRTPAK
jgi:hypothetical protein